MYASIYTGIPNIRSCMTPAFYPDISFQYIYISLKLSKLSKNRRKKQKNKYMSSAIILQGNIQQV